jgi:transcription-repair coupling factor (superfamily II helicase)
MTISELKEIYSADERTALIAESIAAVSPGFKPARIRLKGICGSADALIACTVAAKTSRPHLVICSDKEEAAYFYNDLENLLPDINFFFFPSSSRIPYQVEKTDNANVLHRAETLNAINTSREKYIIISYPEALAEKVVTKKNLSKNTF